MSTRIQRSCLIISALVMNMAPGLDAQARPELPTADTGPGFKSGTTALMWSLLGTLVPIGVGVVASSTAGEASDNPLPGFLILGGMLVGPALGHFYAGRSGHALAGIGIRTLTLAAFLGGAAASWNGDSGGDALLLAGLVASATSVAWDIVRAPHSAEVHNRTIQPGRVSMVVSPLHNAAGVRLGARIAF